MRSRVKGFWFKSKPLIVIWSICAFLFYFLFRMALRSFSDTSKISISNEERRRRLYDKMARSLDENGAQFLQNGETSQSLSLSDLFQLKDGRVTPVLKAINPPVRANVLHLAPEHAIPIVEAVRSIFMPYFDKAIWFQNTTLYHFSMFHASHHVIPVSATEEEIESEAKAIENVAKELCPLSVILDRVVLTSTGVLLGCWQVISGTDPVVLRNRLRTALPRAPDKQLFVMLRGSLFRRVPFSLFFWRMRTVTFKLVTYANSIDSVLQYDVAILHTSFARLLGRPENLPEVRSGITIMLM
ncbi:hypothetical protein LIER_35228 [Lithospermum erythrorhizon]|uniref:Uncharacterized protein n=1 Tax=Lithospermum erythrorhizon TaxID=34254 RepID=A0AAV3NM67_LITER